MIIVNGFYLQSDKVIRSRSNLPIDHPNKKTIARATYHPIQNSRASAGELSAAAGRRFYSVILVAG
jgi:hypothetical protein